MRGETLRGWSYGREVGSSADSSLRFEVLGERPRFVFARLLGEGASSLLPDSMLVPTLEVYRIDENGERILVASNDSWTDAERASLLEVASQKLGLQEIAQESGDAGLFLPLGKGIYEVEFGNSSDIGSEGQFELCCSIEERVAPQGA